MIFDRGTRPFMNDLSARLEMCSGKYSTMGYAKAFSVAIKPSVSGDQ